MESENDVAAALFEKFSPMMYKAAFEVTKNRDDAMDAVQAVCTRVLQSWPLSSLINDPRAFFYKAARNEGRSLVRSQRRRDQREVDVDSIEIPIPDVGSLGDERMGRVRAALAKMKPRLVEVLQLFYNEEYDCSEIAAMQGRLTATVFSDLCRARNKLKQLIAIEENGQ